MNFRSLLARLMQELVKERNEKQEVAVEQTLAVEEKKRNEAKAERERKKQEAIERSRQRQANPNYFSQRIQANNEAEIEKEKSNSSGPFQNIEEQEDEEPEVVEVVESDPFRTIANKSRKKIYVK